MKKNESQIERLPGITFLLLTALALSFVSIISGCVTDAALKLARQKSSPAITYTEWGISSVPSAVKHKNGDIGVCLELFKYKNVNQRERYAINLPESALLWERTDLETIGFSQIKVVGHSDGDATGPPIAEYLYPMAKSAKGCRKLNSSKNPTASLIPVVELTAPEEERSRLHTFLSELDAQGSPEEKLYEITFLKTKEAGADKTNNTRATGYSEVLLVYRPSGTVPEIMDPIAIAGGYESKDESTNLYYMLVPPAVILDAAIIMILSAPYGRM